ncbi:MAG: hypothetical protein GY898_25065 [Proteobacteria bacterium]|nr:hypothetical protein [Pseudomonadota bacterium]
MSTLPRSPTENIDRMRMLLGPHITRSEGREIFLVDADRTLCAEDTSRGFLSRAGGDPMAVKARFKELGYCFESFRFHAQAHVELGSAVFAELAPQVASEVVLHPGAVDFLAAAADRAAVFVVTSGIPRIWRSLLEQHGLGAVPVIGGIDPGAPFVFGRAEKGWAARAFQAGARTLVGVGDSDVDTEMLSTADHAVVVVNHRQNEDLVPHLHGHTSLHQVVPRGQPHPGIREIRFQQVAALPDLPKPKSNHGASCP